MVTSTGTSEIERLEASGYTACPDCGEVVDKRWEVGPRHDPHCKRRRDARRRQLRGLID